MTLAESIERDLAGRIRGGDALPARLTLGALAEAYGVSPTPVRAAVDGLVRRRLLRRGPAGRLSLPARRAGGRRPGRARAAADVSGPDPTTPDPATPDPATPDAAIAEELILMGIRGEGGFVREEAMAERHGIGRTALRSAFQRLAGGGLLEHVPRRGWLVPDFDGEEMDAWIEVREAMELKALDLARGALEPAALDAMLAGNSPAAVRRGAIDNRLHAYLVERAANRYLRTFFESNGRYYDALFDHAGLGPTVLAEMAGQHVAILEALRARRWARARAALSGHIRAQKPVMEGFLRRLAP